MPAYFKSQNDKWVKCISASGTIRAIAVSATETATFFSKRHQMNDDGTIKALSEALVAGLILSSYCKAEEKINLNIQGSGWCKHAIIDANADAEVRGYVVARPKEEVKISKDVGPWGIGLLSVLRTKHQENKPYIGTVPLLTGHLAKDLTFYWLQSEQVQSAVGIEVITQGGSLQRAEGFLIQAMPGATEQDISYIESHLRKFQQFRENTAEQDNPKNLLSYLLEDQTFSILEEKQITAHCPCSLDRVKRSLLLIGEAELTAIFSEGQQTEINCDFCSEKYFLKFAY